VNSKPEYNIKLNTKFGFLKLVDIPALVASCREKWFNQTLCRVNDCVVRLGIIEGEFHWHKHDHEDEFFLVLDGTLYIDIEDSDTVTLTPDLGYTIPKGIKHRPRAPERVVMLMVEGCGVNPTGDE
jgi:mannose-6-phosphate isomerase-like protein (cupin superfamily)